MRRISVGIVTSLVAAAIAGCGSSAEPTPNRNGGATQQPGCTAAPNCGSCSGCLAVCTCQTGEQATCVTACGVGSGGLPGSGGSGSGGAPVSGGTGGVGGSGAETGSVGGTGAGSGGAGAVGGGSGGAGGVGGVAAHACTGPALPQVNDYGARGPFAVTVENNTGPSGQYTLFRPTTLGENGFKHPPTSWGNGITTTPSAYTELLSTVASHGFVVIASNSTNVTAAMVTQGLDWLIQQNSSQFQNQLAVNCGVTIGYSLGGGAAVTAGSHPNVVTTISMHGLQAASENLSGPLMLLTSTDDGFVTKSGYVQPTYNRSTQVPTLMATLDTGRAPDNIGHLQPLGDAGQDRAPAIAWLRYWVYGDESAKPWFFGSDCTLCRTPWVDIQRKNHEWL